MTTKLAVAEEVAILERAREMIEKYGWAHGCYTDKTGAVCLVQAIRNAQYIETGKRGDYYSGELIKYNDNVARCKDDALAMLDGMIAHLIGVPQLP